MDDETLRYLRQTGRPEPLVQLVEAYCKEQGLFHTKATPVAAYTDTLELDLSKVEPSMAGPARPQDRVRLHDVYKNFHDVLPKLKSAAKGGGHMALSTISASAPSVTPAMPEPSLNGGIHDGSVVIAAITSCTNTSNPSVMVAAGILARKALAKGLTSKPWVKTSLAPGSRVVTDYLTESGLLPDLDKLRFNIVGYGCTTCIGNSGPLAEPISKEIEAGSLVVAAVLSGNRNFEGRVHPEVRANYLASPPLVVAYALAGKIDIDWQTEPLGKDQEGKEVFLKDIWPTQQEVSEAISAHLKREQYERVYAHVYTGDEHWQKMDVPKGNLYAWDDASTYVKNPPYFVGMTMTPAPVTDIEGARVLALLGDSITTDHISPAGSIKKDSPAGKYLMAHGVQPADFNQYGARRGNHEVMMRGTFANVRLRNQLAPGTEGGVTRHLPDGGAMSIYDASMLYQKEGVPLLILAGKEYGSGSSRDWAAKGTRLLGVRAVIAESFERIHRSNLVGMGVLPLQFKPGENAQALKLTGEEIYDIIGLKGGIATNFATGRSLPVKARRSDGTETTFTAIVRIDTPQEVLYYQHGGILSYVIRQLLVSSVKA